MSSSLITVSSSRESTPRRKALISIPDSPRQSKLRHQLALRIGKGCFRVTCSRTIRSKREAHTELFKMMNCRHTRLQHLAVGIALAICAINTHSENLRNDWIDPDTGHRVIRISRLPGHSESFYFHQNAFTASGDKMVFGNTSTNGPHDLFVFDWRTRSIER